LGGHKRRLGEVPQQGPGARVWRRSPQEAEAFFVKLHTIFALKYNKQQLLLLLDKINLAAKYKNSKILGGTLPWTSPFINIGGTCPPCPIGIDTPVQGPDL